MNTLQKIFLLLLRIPLIRSIGLVISIHYLVRKLGIDIVSFVTRQFTYHDVLYAITEKIFEKRDLLSYDRLALCRKLRSDNLMSEQEVKWLEDTISIENQIAKESILMSGVSMDRTTLWGPGPVTIRARSPQVTLCP